MPHIHTGPNEHDMTVSMYVLRIEEGQWKCLVHMHRRLGVLMQAGGHIEINETPWQSVQHELREETGYGLEELSVLQPSQPRMIPGAVVHPTPIMVNTHTAGKGPHYHSDFCYAFFATDVPSQDPSDGESSDLRWMTVEEMRQHKDDKVLDDVIEIYDIILSQVDTLMHIPAEQYSLDKPKDLFGF